LAGVLFVDNCDLIHIDMVNDESTLQTFDKMQASVNSWGRLLIATAGSYKLSVSTTYYLFMGTRRESGTTTKSQKKQSTGWLYQCQMGWKRRLIISLSLRHEKLLESGEVRTAMLWRR
jgi:hypothetical protein